MILNAKVFLDGNLMGSIVALSLDARSNFAAVTFADGRVEEFRIKQLGSMMVYLER